MTTPAPLQSYPFRTTDKLRYGDTDRQGHVNNAVFTTLLETGRVEILYHRIHPVLEPNSSFVIVRLELDFLGEINWPGTVEIGTRIAHLGTSSLRLEQGLFQNGAPVATAVSVIVVMDEISRKSKPLPAAARALIATLMQPAEG